MQSLKDWYAVDFVGKNQSYSNSVPVSCCDLSKWLPSSPCTGVDVTAEDIQKQKYFTQVWVEGEGMVDWAGEAGRGRRGGRRGGEGGIVGSGRSILFGTKVGGMGSKGEGRVESCTIAGSMFVPPCHVHLPLI